MEISLEDVDEIKSNMTMQFHNISKKNSRDALTNEKLNGRCGEDQI